MNETIETMTAEQIADILERHDQLIERGLLSKEQAVDVRARAAKLLREKK